MSVLLHQLSYEQRTFWRNRESAVFIFIFPLLLYALLGSVYSGEIDGDPAVDVLLAGLFGYAAATTAFAGLAIFLVLRREMGLLKRVRSTPLPAWTYIAAVLLSMLVVLALESIALLASAGSPSARACRRTRSGSRARSSSARCASPGWAWERRR